MTSARKPNFSAYLYAFAAVIVATVLGFVMFRYFTLSNLVMIYLLATLIVATRGYRGPAVVTSVLGVLCFDFFFVPPRWTLNVSDAQYIWTFIVMLATAVTISQLTIRLREEAEAARQGQRLTAMIHALTQRLTRARGAEQVLGAAADHVSDVFSGKVVAYMPVNGALRAAAFSKDAGTTTEKERGVAEWVFAQEQPAGLGTASLPDGSALYVPLKGSSSVNGVLRIQPNTAGGVLSAEQRLLLDAFTHQIGLAMDVDRLQENAKKAEVEVEAERLRNALLSSVSHDLRTPLAAMIGSASALLEKEQILKTPALHELVENIESEGKRLTRLVQNLLEVTRFESGAVQLRKEPTPLEEIIGSALERLEKNLAAHTVQVELPEDLPLVPVDAVLLEQVFMNLLENAVRHTPAKSRIILSAKADGGKLRVSVMDEGTGLSQEELGHAFDKFFRGAASKGSGLGLAISRAILQAHGGRIWVENRASGGAAFYVELPLN